MIIIQEHQEVCGNTMEMNQFDNIANFRVRSNIALFKFKQKLTSVTAAVGTKDAEIIVPLN